MFDFGTDGVPVHTEDDTEFFDPAPGTWTLVVGPDPDTGFEVACRIDDLVTAELLARAYHRKRLPRAADVWAIGPDEVPKRMLSESAELDSRGGDAEQRMAASSQAPSTYKD